jgi:ClpP class serine protease
MQKSLDYMFSLMTDTISANRNIFIKDLIEGEVVGGDVFIGEQGINAGLVDQILTREKAIDYLQDVIRMLFRAERALTGNLL